MEIPPALPGHDLTALVAGGDTPVRDAVAVEYHSTKWGDTPTPLRCWRTETSKYVATVGGIDEAYDLTADPAETRNLAQESWGPLETLAGDLRRWQAETGDQWPHVRQPPQARSLEPGPWGKLAQP